MERMFQSSIMGNEFINFRKQTPRSERAQFSYRVRSQGMGKIPVVVDSVDSTLALLLSEMEPGRTSERCRQYGKQMVFHMDDTINDVITETKIVLVKKNSEHLLTKIRIGLENGELLDLSRNLGELYKKYKNTEDKILYLLVTQQETMYEYIISILKYIALSIKSKIV